MSEEEIDDITLPKLGSKLSPHYKEILRMYFIDKIKVKAITEKFNCAQVSVNNIVKKYGVPFSRSEGRRQHYFESGILDDIDEQWKAYFLGWMFSDGNVYTQAKKNTVSLCIVETDRYILDYFNEKFYRDVKRPLNSRPARLKKGTQYLCKPLTRFQIDSVHLCKKLIEHGVVCAKSKILGFPKTIPIQYMPHFIRGLFEGDGCIKINNVYGLSVQIFSASNTFLVSLKTFLEDEVGITISIKENLPDNSKVGYIVFRKKDYIKKFYHYIYKNAEMNLQRKKEKFKQDAGTLLVNSLQTPDGTILVSRHTHDYVSHKDMITGTTYAIDGGISYLRWMPGGDYKDLSVYSDDPHEKIRKGVERGGRGINGDEPLTYVTLDKINDDWLKAIIKYEEEHRPANRYIPIYRKEVEYRKENNIVV